MEFPDENIAQSARTSYVFQQEVEEEKEIPVYDIESDDESIEIEYMKLDSLTKKCMLDNAFIEVFGTPKNLDDDHLLQTDPLLGSNAQESKDIEKKIEILDESPNHCKVGKGWTQLAPCTRNCFLRVPEEEQKKIFHSYWYEGTFHSRFDYVNDMTEIVEDLASGNSRKLCTRYFLNTSKGRKSVCRRCFCHILDVSQRFMKTVFDQKLCERKKLPSASPKASLEAENTRMEFSDALITETIELSEDELVNEMASSFSNDDSFLFETIRQNSKIKPELRISGPSSKFLRDNKIGKGWKRLLPCTSGCFVKVTEEDQKNLFDSYWKEATFHSRFKFLNDMLVAVPVKKRYKRASTARIKRYSVHYYLTTSKGSQKVCRPCFKATINESDSLIDSVLEKKWCVMKTIKKLRDDYVEVRDIDPNDEEIKKVEEHIKKFPLCESDHFSNHSSEKYLPMGLSLKIMYELYNKEISNPVSINWYQNVLVQTDFKFRPTYLGKCEKCEIATQKFRTSTDPEEKSRLNYLLTSHLVDAREGQDSITQDENVAKRSNNTLLVCSFAFQMTLPTPCLKEPTAYYKRPFWTYNLTIQQQPISRCTRRIPKFYMWHEGHGKKTANEIASCLYQYLLELPRCVKSVIFYSTSNNRDNRSKSISKMFLHFLENHKTLKTVDHKFLIPGHSQIQNNLENGWDEMIVKEHRGKVQEPKDWYEVFKKPFKPKNEPEVVVMTPEKFHDFERLWKDEDHPFIDEKVKWVRYTKGVVHFKNSWVEKDRFQVLNCMNQSQLCELRKTKLCNLDNVSITEEKKKGLLQLLPFLSPKVKSFYEGLPVQMSVCSNDSFIQESVQFKRKFEDVREPKETCTLTQQVIIKSDIELISEGEKPPKLKKSPNTIDSTESEIVFIKDEEKTVKDDNEKFESDNKTKEAWKFPIRLPLCPSECCLKITEDDQKRIFNNYWHKGTFESRIDFISNLMEISSTPIYRLKSGNNKIPRFSTKFYLDTKKGREFVCKLCFRHVLDISVSFISAVLNKKWEQINGVNKPNSLLVSQISDNKLQKDIEELKSNHPTLEKIKEVEDHIKKFPLCANQHFIHPASEKYLPTGLTLTIQSMYDIYRNEVLNPLGIGKYQEILHKADLKFQPKFFGKCEKCEGSSELMPLMGPKLKSSNGSLSIDHSVLNKPIDSNDVLDQENDSVNNSLPTQTCVLKEEVIIESDDQKE